jgi:excisionase family DNA binding protein
VSGGLIPLAQAARELGLDPSTLRHQAIAGRIAATKIGDRWLVDAEEVYRYQLEQAGRPGRPRKEVAP